MTRREVIQAPSSEIREAFKSWLVTAYHAGVRLVVLEGLTGAGKTTLLKYPFPVGAGPSLHIEIDEFCRQEIPLKGVGYCDSVDRQALQARLRAGLASRAPVIVIEGPLAWPLIEPFAEATREHIRRVYLKRMMHLKPDFWIDEDYLTNPNYWPPTDFHRSIYQYHAEHQPWLDADLVLERIED